MPGARRASGARPGPRRVAPAGTVPLARALSKRGLASRAEAIALILAGRVRLDGRVVRDPGTAVVPERMAVDIDGAATSAPAWRTIALHKPRGVVTTRRDPEGRPTVHDLIAPLGDGLAPAGRLDLASTGLIVCTNDTRLASWLTSPASDLDKEYVVTVRGRLDDATLERLAGGVEDRGEWLRPASLRLLKASSRESQVEVVLTEGKNREIRRLFAAAGHDVTRLLRVRIGGLELGSLAPGAWRDIRREKLATYFPEYSGGRSRHPRRTDPAR